MENENVRYKWVGVGDLNGFFGLMFDNIAVLSSLAGTLIIGFQFPANIVYTRMIPGTTLGVLFGDLVYTWMAFRLARKKVISNVTAMPLGLDTPSTIGLAVTVLGPAFIMLKQAGHSVQDAAIMTWHLGMATMVLIGVLKVIMSFCGNWVQRTIPRAGLLGSLAGVGLALIGFIPLLDIFRMPLVGTLSLGLTLYALVAKGSLPGKIPGVLAAIALGTILYYLLNVVSPDTLGSNFYKIPEFHFRFGLPLPNLGFIDGFIPSLKFLPVAIPFAILTIVGGINVTESARVAGDDYSARQILMTEALATLLSGICGGVAQSCPYIGHPAYKRMGTRAGYTLFTALFIGLGGVFGYVSVILEIIPRAALAPILVFISLEIVGQAFKENPSIHIPAVILSILPSVSRLLAIHLEMPEIVPVQNLDHLISNVGGTLPEVLVIIALGNGFILTGMLWGSFLAEMINHRLRVCSIYCFVMALFSFFGIIHSSMPDSNVYFPWLLTGAARMIPYEFAKCYLFLGLMMFALSFTKDGKAPIRGALSNS
ncbi:MAG: hypothetical protein ACP5U1_04255 [Desulfomonilaceae bacterium]